VHASVIPEPFGQVVVEGMALGLPVVASGAGGPAEVITDGVDGLLYPPGDVSALASLLRKLADDPGLRRRLGDEGVSTAAKYAPDVIAAQVEAVYATALAGVRG
jgi:glycosyltransferase involved in cell wall biosynthesis